MQLYYNVEDKPPIKKMLLAALQQVMAILAGTIAVPMIVGNGMSQSAALFGAGIGTLVYLLITKFNSPVFLGSSFSFAGPMLAAFSGALSMSIGYFGLVLGAIFSGLVYLILSIIVKFVGTNWINKLMPPIIIGPTVAVIGLTLAPNAINNMMTGNVFDASGKSIASTYLTLLCGLVTLIMTIIISRYSRRTFNLIPFILGIISGYVLALIFTIFGNAFDVSWLKIIDFSVFKNISWVPDFAFIKAIDGIKEFSSSKEFWSYALFIFFSFVPVSFVCFTEHIADHKHLSFVIDRNLLDEPGLKRTLFGDGLGSMVGAFFGGCPNTTYGESISCTAISKNASIYSIISAAVMCIVMSFIGPLMAFFESIPSCVIGGLCVVLYGFIATSGFHMLHDVDFSEHKNIFVVAVILVIGVGGLAINFRKVEFSPIACALFLGILVNYLVNIKKDKNIDKNKDEDKNE